MTKENNKTKAHIRYKLQDGTRVPGVTTLTGILDKPALKYWANKIGLEGIEIRKYVDDKADIGTLAHYMVLCDFKGKTPDTLDYSKNQIEQAETCLIKFWDWKSGKEIEPILLEAPLVSEKHRFGGTCDIYAKVNGTPTLIDLKTGRGIYDEMLYQVSAYKMLLAEHKYLAEQCMILRIGRNEEEGFETKVLNSTALYEEIFLRCLEIYNLRKQLKGEKNDN